MTRTKSILFIVLLAWAGLVIFEATTPAPPPIATRAVSLLDAARRVVSGGLVWNQAGVSDALRRARWCPTPPLEATLKSKSNF